MFRYQEKLHLTPKQLLTETTMTDIEFAAAVWEADRLRSKLEEERAEAKARARKNSSQ